MDVNDLDLPDDISYIDKMLWVKRDYEDEIFYIGITDFAQQILGDIISVYFSNSEEYDEGDEFFTVTSLEDEIVLEAPFACNVIEENSNVKHNPEELNEKPYVNWIFKIALEDEDDFFNLLDREDIIDQIQEWITENPDLKLNPTVKKKTTHRKKLAQLVKEDNIERILEDDPYAVIPDDDAHDPFEGNEEAEDDFW